MNWEKTWLKVTGLLDSTFCLFLALEGLLPSFGVSSTNVEKWASETQNIKEGSDLLCMQKQITSLPNNSFHLWPCASAANPGFWRPPSSLFFSYGTSSKFILIQHARAGISDVKSLGNGKTFWPKIACTVVYIYIKTGLKLVISRAILFLFTFQFPSNHRSKENFTWVGCSHDEISRGETPECRLSKSAILNYMKSSSAKIS